MEKRENKELERKTSIGMCSIGVKTGKSDTEDTDSTEILMTSVH